MNDPSRKTLRILRLMIFFSVFSMFIAGAPKPSTADKVQQAGWRFEIEPGKSKSSTLTIENRCSTPHRFRVNSKIKYLRVEESTDSLLIAANSTKELGVQFDAMGLKSKTYRDKVTVECLDCKKEKGCTQNRDVLPVEMIVADRRIYSYCVASESRYGPPFRCTVFYVRANFNPGSCEANWLTIPNDGRPVPKVGDLLAEKYCDLRPNPNKVVRFYCVGTQFRTGISLPLQCEVISVTPNYGESCKANLRAVPNLPGYVPKVGDLLAEKYCDLLPPKKVTKPNMEGAKERP